MPSAHLIAAAVAAIAALLLLASSPAAAIRDVPIDTSGFYAEAPHFRNGDSCPAAVTDDVCNPAAIHIAITLDASYLRGSVAAVHSLLKHAACPDLLFFHFTAAKSDNSPALRRAIVSAFPNLHFQIYRLAGDRLSGLISPSVRVALENPLNYARTYLADLLPLCVRRVVYLDSDLVAVDDVRRLYATPIPSPAVIAAPEYCHANFTRYFNSNFWSDNGEWGRDVFTGRRRRPCYFNTGVMVIDLMRWRMGRYTKQIEDWMMQQRERGIYELGSLPPFLLVFAGDIVAVEHRWNVHGLGGDNVSGSCRPLHPGPVSLLHWSGKGKPWDRLDAGTPCPVDRLWAPYDLYVPPSSSSLFASW